MRTKAVGGKITGERQCEIFGVLILALTVFMFLALVTDGYEGDVRRSLDAMEQVPNMLGEPGAIVAGYLYLLLGHAAHILYCLTAVWGGMLLRHKPLDRLPSRGLGMLLLLISVAGILDLDFASGQEVAQPGGIVGDFVGTLLSSYFWTIGSNVILITLAVVGILLSTEFLLLRMFTGGKNIALVLLGLAFRLVRNFFAWMASSDAHSTNGVESAADSDEEIYEEDEEEEPEPEEPKDSSSTPGNVILVAPRLLPPRRDLSEIRIRPTFPVASQPGPIPFDEIPVIANEDDRAADSSRTQPPAAVRDEPSGDKTETVRESEEGNRVTLFDAKPKGPPGKPASVARRKNPEDEALPADYVYPKQYTKPPLTLLDLPPATIVADLGDRLRQVSALLEEKLLTFGIEARVTDVTRGPTITRYELEPAPGIKVSRFLSLADDLALALKAHRVRVEAPIPGKGRVGIEVPNQDREPVVVRDLFEAPAFRCSKAKIPLALGKDIAGDTLVVDLASMPHLLVAGATGSGKTVCVKTLLASLLFTKTPSELQLMLIDPKMVELSIFADIPHLMTPVVTDAKKAASALNWLIVEMEERFRLFAHVRTRNIDVYNESVANGEIEMVEPDGAATESVDAIRKLPYIVCVIDELADLMMLARAEVEDAIGRLAQLARAVGIHLIIATQRPSVDVLTGVIKANFPARISFQVSSRVDSRCILDEIGAEQLIGKGDMLYLPAGQSKPTRIQGAFVSDAEMSRLIAYLKSQAPPQYRDEIENFGKSKDSVDDLAEEDDELFEDAVRVVVETGQASISMVQRRLRVGYTRAARLIDMMELKGIVGPHSGSKAREILVTHLPADDEVA